MLIPWRTRERGELEAEIAQRERRDSQNVRKSFANFTLTSQKVSGLALAPPTTIHVHQEIATICAAGAGLHGMWEASGAALFEPDLHDRGVPAAYGADQQSQGVRREQSRDHELGACPAFLLSNSTCATLGRFLHTVSPHAPPQSTPRSIRTRSSRGPQS